MKHITLALLLLVFVSASTFGRSNFFMPTDLGSSAEMISIGNIEGFSDTSNSVFENPAGLYRVEESSVSLFTSTIIDEVFYNNISISTKTKYGKIGFGYMEAAVHDIPKTQDDGNGQGEVIGHHDLRTSVAKLSLHHQYSKKWELGASLAHYSIELDTVNGSGTNIDLGAIGKFDYYTLSLVAKNLLPDTKVNYNNDGEEVLATQYLASILYPFSNEFDILGQYKIKHNRSLLSGGIVYKPYFLPIINFRVGYKEFLVLDQARRNVTMGITLFLNGLKFNYAYEKGDHFEFDNKNYFSVSLNF